MSAARLPDNDMSLEAASSSTRPTNHVRPYKACSACRSRKIRCIVQDRASGGVCLQCQKDGTRCTFESKIRGYDVSSRLRKTQRKRAKLAVQQEASPSEITIDSQEEFSIRSSADALLFLSGAAARHQASPTSPTGIVQVASQVGEASSGAEFTTPADEINTSSSIPGGSRMQNLDAAESPLITTNIQDKVATFRCRLFWENIVLPHEALVFVLFFFTKLYPIFPFLPHAYYTCATSKEPDTEVIRLLFEEDEILLGCIVTVSSRYHHLPNHAIGGYERSCEIHSRCWNWTRRQISQVLFEGSRPRNLLSFVEAFLMLAEWLPKPVHALVEGDQHQSEISGQASQTSRHFINEQILQPAFRTDHVAWSYVGNAFLLLRSLPPDRRTCAILKTSNRYLVILFGCLIMSQSLARRLGRQPLMSFDDVNMTQISDAFRERNQCIQMQSSNSIIAHDLSIGTSEKFHEAFIEIIRLLGRAHEVLHPPTVDGIVESKKQAQDTSPQHITLMQHFDHLNQAWKTKYWYLTEASDPNILHFSQLMLLADFEYLRLYEFSTSLGACLKQGGDGAIRATRSGASNNLQQDSDGTYSPKSPAFYLEQAIEAAEILLRLLIGFQLSNVEKALRYASARHYMKIVFAAVFLIQVLRTGMPSAEYRETLTATLKDTISTLESCSIDTAHPAFRYAILLRGLMSEIQRSQRALETTPFSLSIHPKTSRNHHDDPGRNRGRSSRTNRNTNQIARETSQSPLEPVQISSTLGEGTFPWQPSAVQEETRQAAQVDNWLGANEPFTAWEDSLSLLDDDTFLQSLIGMDLFN